ncbi:hypothetical protein CXB51_032194 [Gossypium anomalum]|uniref:Uncharacterized protein n=1 Tax=Gossypium anomalum TaxID=47600 RepID=A0A8J5YDF9_9ROSI|nr:hypothetical protein CXB51_032194 [Gossypium anomalum]
MHVQIPKIYYRRRRKKMLSRQRKSFGGTKVKSNNCITDMKDLNSHGTAYAFIVVGTLTKLKWLKDVFRIFYSKLQRANLFSKIASYKVSSDKVITYKTILDKVDLIMISLRTYNLLNSFLYLRDLVNMEGYLAIKENIVVCTSSSRYNFDRKFVTRVELRGRIQIKNDKILTYYIFFNLGFGSFMDKYEDYCKLIHWSEHVLSKFLFKSYCNLNKQVKKKRKFRNKIKQKPMQKFTRLFMRKMETFGKVIFKSGISLNPYDPYVLKSSTSMANAVIVDMLSYIKSFH